MKLNVVKMKPRGFSELSKLLRNVPLENFNPENICKDDDILKLQKIKSDT